MGHDREFYLILLSYLRVSRFNHWVVTLVVTLFITLERIVILVVTSVTTKLVYTIYFF